MTRKIERRMITGITVKETRTDADPGSMPVIEGYAAVYNKPAVISNSFAEQFRTNAFADSLASPDSLVIACFNHDDEAVPLARYKNGSGTLALSEDSNGLKFSFQPANTSLGRDVLESVRRGDTDGASIGFYATDDDWSGSFQGRTLRTVNKGRVADICLTPMPAYDQTSVNVRNRRSAQFTDEDYAALVASKTAGVTVEAESRARHLRLRELQLRQAEQK